MTATARVLGDNLVIVTSNSGQLRAVFPVVKEAVVRGQSVVAVPYTLEAVRVLANLGIAAPSPIRSKYDWPGRFTPRWYQIDTADAFTVNRRMHCHNSMRTGKTLSALWAADYLRRTKRIGRTLIVAPLSTLWDVWEQNIFEHFPLRTFATLHGSRQKRLDLLAKPHDFYIINHHGLGIVEEALAARPDIDLVIVDECFPAGTKVLTPAGERCIETVELGDLVITSWGQMPVTHVFKKTAVQLLRVLFEDGTYVDCTSEHPFATDQGWVEARDLTGLSCLRGSDLPTLREGVQSVHVVPKAQPWKLLLQSVWNCLSRSWRDHDRRRVPKLRSSVQESVGDGSVQEAKVLQSYMLKAVGVGQQPQHASRVEENLRETEGAIDVEQGSSSATRGDREDASKATTATRAVPQSSWGQRYRNDLCRSAPRPAPSSDVQPQRSNKDEDATRLRISDLLQSGLWGHRSEGSDRGGRRKPQLSYAASTRPQEGGVSLGVRVVGVQNLELSGACSVWNLEVAGPHDYIADGKVVHNCAVFRNTKAKTLFKPLNEILNKQGIDRSAWGLTGTPTPQEPTDAYGQCKLITPQNYRGHFTAFKNETMYQLNQFKWVPRRGSEETVARVLSPSIRFERSVCTDLEPCFIERRAELSDEQHQHYRALLQHAVTEVRGAAVTAVNAAVLIQKITQVACGVVYGTDGEFLKIDFGPRLKILEELIEENNEKVLVFVPFTGALEAVATALRKRWSVETVDGSTSPAKRLQIFRDFRSSKDPHVLVCHPQCMSHGLDLTAASLSIWYAPYWRAEIYQQANARTDGSKQTAKIDIAHIYATPEEHRIYQVLKEKGRLQDAVLDLLKNS